MEKMRGGLAARGDDAEVVVAKAAEAVGALLDEFQFAVEAFGDAVVFGEAPHPRERFESALEGLGERVEARKAAAAQLHDVREQSPGVLATAPRRLRFEVEQVTDRAHFFVEWPQHRLPLQERLELLALTFGEVLWALAPWRLAVVAWWR